MTPISARGGAAPPGELAEVCALGVIRRDYPRFTWGPASAVSPATLGQWVSGMRRSGQGRQPQAAEPSDFEADLVAVLVVPVPDELDDVDEAESEDELVDSLEDAWVPVLSEPLCGSLPELPPGLVEPRPELLPRRESLRESLR